MPPVFANWPLEVHDRLLAKLFRLVWARHAAGVPALPRKQWAVPELAQRLVAHASAWRLCFVCGYLSCLSMFNVRLCDCLCL